MTGLILGLGAGTGLGSRSGSERSTSALAGFDGWDVALAGVGVGALVAPAIFERDPPRLGSGAWSDCTPDGGSALNGLDRWGRGLSAGLSQEGRDQANAFSDVTLHAALALPFGLVLADGAAPSRGRDGLVVVETYLVTVGLTNLAKHLWHRPRPFAHFGEPESPGDLQSHFAQLSFPSGHASSSFAAAVAAGMLASAHDHPNRRWIWASGLTLAAATGTLRIAADRHYLTDVVAGAALGSLVGWLVPHLHRPGKAPPLGEEAPRSAPPMTPVGLKLSGSPATPGRGAWLAVGIGAGGGALALTWRW